MEKELVDRLKVELNEIPLIDPHTHINPHEPAARSLDDLLGYHYYTELAHSVGMPHEPLKEAFDPKERARIILTHAQKYENTVQWSWFVELCQVFFGWQHDGIRVSDAESLWKAAEVKCQQPDWWEQVWKQTRLEKVFLTNDFDDPLTEFDTGRFVPCLRTDELVFKWMDPSVQTRLGGTTSVEVHDGPSLGRALDVLFASFKKRGARACAISLPPGFEPCEVSDSALATAWKANEVDTVARGMFWRLAERCRSHRLPFDLMIGVNRRIYEKGVYQGQDLFDQRTSLIHYAKLFNAFPEVRFCVSVLTSSQNQELASYSWIFPNVITSGHWWYANVPTLIDRDLRLRLQCVPGSKQLGYYSDAYKLEFVLPKYNMYRKVLAGVLAEEYVLRRKWSEEKTIGLGRQLLRTNLEDCFFN